MRQPKLKLHGDEGKRADGLNMNAGKSDVLKFRGPAHFRARLILATLSNKKVRISGIREDDEQPGLTPYEASFLRLLDKMTNGSNVEINATGTALRYEPGLLIGGNIEHDCGPSGRAIGWFLQGVLPLAPFGKRPLNLELRGITNDDTDPSVDNLRSVALAVLWKFGIGEDEDGGALDLKVKCRGAPPLGGGTATFRCPVMRELNTIDATDPGLIKKVRGTAFCTRMSPTAASRV